jgi:hypothetical protein
MPFPVHQPESIQVTLQFALLLRDGFASSDQLLGDVQVSCGAIDGRRKDASGAFLFFDLAPGACRFNVTSDLDTPYYQPTALNINVPMPSPAWPAFPDRTLADPTLPLGDPGQTAAYQAQRAQATLLPTTAYPFPAGATLVRGTIQHGGQPLPAATVQQQGSTDPAYTTASDGQFVLFVSNPPAVPQQITVNATHPGLAGGNVTVTIVRGLTVSTTINL